MKQTLTLLAALALAPPAAAGELVVGLGTSLFHSEEARDGAVLSFAYRGKPIGSILGADFGLGVTADIHTTGNAFVGAGPGLRWRLGGPWFLDAAIAPGIYFASTHGDLGGAFQFRSSLGIGYQMDGGTAISLAVTHKSNAHIEEFNPGMEEVLLRWHLPF